MFEKVKHKFDAVNKLVQKTGEQKIIELSKFLKDRISHPDSFVAMLGETSSGKTTLLNGFLGGNYLYTSVQPSTGAIVELECTPEEVPHQYYAIFQNATAAKLSREDFIEYSKTPKDNIKRLWMKARSNEYGDSKLRLFDTPGYGSVIEKHEEILTEFLPESNVIIYVVCYKVGIQQDDYNFINYVSEIITEDTEFVLVVNRIPESIGKNDKRINEVKRYVSDMLHYMPKTFLVPDIPCENSEYPLPKSDELWAYIKENILSEKHQDQLEKSFEGYVFGIFERCEAYIMQKAAAKKMDQNQKDVLVKDLENTIAQLETAKDQLVKPTFEKLVAIMPSKLSTVKRNVINAIHQKIDESNKSRQQEIVGYVNSHMLQFETKKQVDEIRFYIEAKLNDLNKKIEDMLNQCIQKIEHTIELNFSVETATMAKGILKKYASNALEQSILGYFKQFAGRGGTGIANGAKHLLKKVGDFFGHTFSRETHNKLASTLSRIGATSAKAVGIAVVVVLEAVFMIVDAVTWQGNLKKKVTEAVKKWHDEVLDAIQKDLKNLEKENLNLLDEHISGLQEIIDNVSKNDFDDERIDELTTLLDTVKVEIGEYSYE
jgi:GTPase SAR1 family protein